MLLSIYEFRKNWPYFSYEHKQNDICVYSVKSYDILKEKNALVKYVY